MKIKRKLFVGALVLTLGFGAIATPIVANAEDGTQNGYGLKLGQYFAGTMKDTVASTLGITIDELYSLRTAGESIAAIAEDKGVAIEEITTAAMAAKTEQIEELYSEGKITEEQKDLMLSQLGENMIENINKTEMGNNGNGNGAAHRYNQSADFEPGQGRGNGAGFGYRNVQ